MEHKQLFERTLDTTITPRSIHSRQIIVEVEHGLVTAVKAYEDTEVIVIDIVDGCYFLCKWEA